MLALLVFGIGCDSRSSSTDPRESSSVVSVYTSFYPTTYFAERIGGEAVEVTCPVPDDADAIFWIPSDEEVVAYQSADLIVLNGAEFEKWSDKVSLPTARVVRSADGFRDRWLDFTHSMSHSHGPEGDHAHEGVDGHTWLDPILAIEQAKAIEQGLSGVRPQASATFSAGLASLIADLEALDASLKRISTSADEVWIYASHPAYAYPARRYGWRMVNLDLDPEAMPADSVFSDLTKSLAEKPARFLIWESTPDPVIAERVKSELGLESVVVPPAELVARSDLEQGATYLSIMKENTKKLERVLTP